MARGSCSGTIAAVQLLSWCAAGALLVYRGVVTLRREPTLNGSRNETVNVDLSDVYENRTRVYVGQSSTRSWDIRPAAIVMLAMGVVMLAVGPAVLVLRRFDADRRRRRFLKLSWRDPDVVREDEPPPSYEEAADGVPRYSSLFEDLDFDEDQCLRADGQQRLPEAATTTVQ